MDGQIRLATADRERMRAQFREERKRKAKKDKRRRKRSRSYSRSSSRSSSSDPDAGLNALGSDDHTFRQLGREHPGVSFASVVADCRSELGQRGLDLDIGPQGPVVYKWYETCIFQHASAADATAVRSELLMLVTALDEFRQGRMLEVADVLASRARMLAYSIDRRNGTDAQRRQLVAREFLTYAEETHCLVSNATVDAAIKIVIRGEEGSAGQASPRQVLPLGTRRQSAP